MPRDAHWATSTRTAITDLDDFALFQQGFTEPGPFLPASMVLIPGGAFEMGCHAETGETCRDGEELHDVYLDSFYMGVYEVTNRQYCSFLNSAYGQGLIDNPGLHGGEVHKADDTEPYCDTTTSSTNSRITWNGTTFGVISGKEEHPMLTVSWYGAVAYANWLSAQHGRTPCYELETWDCDFNANGYRLPTEAEWEYAARGGEHDPYYMYPWGNALDGSKANYQDSGDEFDGGPDPETTPVGYYDGGQTPAGADMANGYGLYDMAGNVFEWCYDWYDPDYYSSSPYENPQGPPSAPNGYRVLRGGAWSSVGGQWLRCACRRPDLPGYLWGNLGFRIVTRN